jgi:hypothetical protein
MCRRATYSRLGVDAQYLARLQFGGNEHDRDHPKQGTRLICSKLGLRGGTMGFMDATEGCWRLMQHTATYLAATCPISGRNYACH